MAFTRRRFIGGSALVPAAIWLAGCGDDDKPKGDPAGTTSGGTTTDQALAPTPACDDHGDVTHEQTEGPYFKPDSPERTKLREDGVAGERLLVTGTVVDTACRPIKRALLDFWQADGDGQYDNEGFRLRGHQYTDSRGRFTLDTVKAGLYPGRTRHIHVKVQRPHGQVVTTQLYFPGEPQNQSDGIFDEALLMDVSGSKATFGFVLA
jgi:protocatechuate 3,4-dioxygenase beta subunit